jgi:hypothetical protein
VSGSSLSSLTIVSVDSARSRGGSIISLNSFDGFWDASRSPFALFLDQRHG